MFYLGRLNVSKGFSFKGSSRRLFVKVSDVIGSHVGEKFLVERREHSISLYLYISTQLRSQCDEIQKTKIAKMNVLSSKMIIRHTRKL